MTYLPVEINNLTQLTELYIYNNTIENILNPVIQQLIKRLNIIYNDKQNVNTDTQNMDNLICMDMFD